jgi:hypothetical protein
MNIQHAPASLNEVRLAVLRQHTQLAQLLDELEQHSNAVIGGAVVDGATPLESALGLLLLRFSRHLDYEEAHLARWLPASKRAELLSDHEEQRQRALGLVHDRDVFSDARTLAREALAFVHSLRKDIANEAEVLRALA